MLMETVKRQISRGCLYSAVISLVFFLFSFFGGVEDPRIPLQSYLLILLFGQIIAAADLLFRFEKLPPVLRFLLHYLVLLSAFCLIFLVSGRIVSAGSVAAVFVAIVVFTALYFAFVGVFFLVRKTEVLLSKRKEK